MISATSIIAWMLTRQYVHVQSGWETPYYFSLRIFYWFLQFAHAYDDIFYMYVVYECWTPEFKIIIFAQQSFCTI